MRLPDHIELWHLAVAGTAMLLALAWGVWITVALTRVLREVRAGNETGKLHLDAFDGWRAEQGWGDNFRRTQHIALEQPAPKRKELTDRLDPKLFGRK